LTIIRLLQETGDAAIGGDYEEQGILSGGILERHLGFQPRDFYLCGPPGFMQAVHDAQTNHGVADRRRYDDQACARHSINAIFDFPRLFHLFHTALRSSANHDGVS